MRGPAILGAFVLALAAPASGAPRAPAPARPALVPCGASGLAQAVAGRLAKTLHWDAQSLRLDEALHKLAYRSGIPVSAVLSAPLPFVEIPRGDFAPAALLGRFVGAIPGYTWYERRGIIWFAHRSVRDQPENFLNWRVPEIETQGQVGQFLPVLKDLTNSPLC
ncbi:MAG: hypothetical protein ACRDN0_10895 [Trebonia sp.]